jgi:hypothetical protein
MWNTSLKIFSNTLFTSHPTIQQSQILTLSWGKPTNNLLRQFKIQLNHQFHNPYCRYYQLWLFYITLT